MITGLTNKAYLSAITVTDTSGMTKYRKGLTKDRKGALRAKLQEIGTN